MKKIIAVLGVCAAMFLPTYATSEAYTGDKADAQLSARASGGVFICLSEGAEKYHSNANCRGLKRCRSEIRRVSVAEAQKYGYKPCKICY